MKGSQEPYVSDYNNVLGSTYYGVWETIGLLVSPFLLSKFLRSLTEVPHSFLWSDNRGLLLDFPWNPLNLLTLIRMTLILLTLIQLFQICLGLIRTFTIDVLQRIPVGLDFFSIIIHYSFNIKL